MTKKSVAIITARGGSKRIPRKNIKEFCGKPIIAYSIEAAIDSGIFDEVMVSTDDKEIAEISEQYGAKVPFMRSSQNSNDYATSADVLTEVIECYRSRGQEFEYFCCIYPTAPFVTAEKLKVAMEMLDNNPELDAVVPIVKFSFPPQRAFVVEDEKVKIIRPEIFQTRSQDLEPIYHDCGQYYCMKTKEFLETQRLVLKNTYPIITPETEVQDIDNMEDWNIAEIKYQKMISKEG